MATFVKLTNGDMVNIQHIKSIKRYKYMSVGTLARFFSESRQEEGIQEGGRVEAVPSIQLQLGSDPDPMLLKYKSEQERDAEFERIEAILLQPRSTVTFGSLMFDTTLVQSISVDWKLYSSDLQVWVKMPGMRRFMVEVDQANQAEWERCISLLAQFNMQLPAERNYDDI